MLGQPSPKPTKMRARSITLFQTYSAGSLVLDCKYVSFSLRRFNLAVLELDRQLDIHTCIHAHTYIHTYVRTVRQENGKR